MPCSSIAYQQDHIVRILFWKFFKKNISTFCIAIRHRQKETFSAQRFYCSKRIAVFPYVMARHRGSLTFRTPASFNSNNFRGFRSAGTMPSRFDHSAVAHKSAVSTRWFSRFVLLPVLSCASLHSFSSLLVFRIPVFQVLWISIARLVRFVRARDYWAVTFGKNKPYILKKSLGWRALTEYKAHHSEIP